MPQAVPAAFPFIEVRIDTSALAPVAQRAPGVIAIVGKSDKGTALPNKPLAVDTLDQAAGLFDAKGAAVPTPLYKSLQVAMLQDPRPSKIYGVKVEGEKYAEALAALEAADDVTFVALANESQVDPALIALKNHVETMSAEGHKRLGVAMVDPNTNKSNSYVTDVLNAIKPLKSTSSRMVLVAARGATHDDAAAAAAAAMAGFAPHISMVLKRVSGVTMPVEQQYSPSEIKDLSEGGVIPIIDPALIVGESLHFAEGRCFTTNDALLYIDIVRTLDDIDFRLKAGLIGMVGDARITKVGLIQVKTRTEGILGVLKRNAVIDDFSVDITVLNILSIPESARTPAETETVKIARGNRMVDMFISVTYGPAIHRLLVTLAPKF